MSKVTPCLWFEKDGDTAAEFYVSVFKACGQTASVDAVSHYGEGQPMPKGTPMMIEFTLAGRQVQILNAGPTFQLSPAVSLSVACKDQNELDAFWDGLIAGGQPSQCGWLTDRYGLSWQIVPEGLSELLTGDPARTQRVMDAVMQMLKLDIATMRAAADS